MIATLIIQDPVFESVARYRENDASCNTTTPPTHPAARPTTSHSTGPS